MTAADPPEPAAPPKYPFARIRARLILPWAGLLAVAMVWLWETAGESVAAGGLRQVLDQALWVVLSVVVVGVPWLWARKEGLVLRDLYPAPPPRRDVPWLLSLVFPSVGAALLGIWAVFVPLSYVAPDFVRGFILEDEFHPFDPGPPFPLAANLLGFVYLVVLAPVTEEFFFRGLLLRRWAYRWGTRPAVILTSLLFAVLHADYIGVFLFGVVMCGLYGLYRTLWAPTLVHAANNFTAWALLVTEEYGVLPYPDPATLDELRAAWWMPVVGAALVLPWVFPVSRRLRARAWDFGPPRETPAPTPAPVPVPAPPGT